MVGDGEDNSVNESGLKERKFFFKKIRAMGGWPTVIEVFY